jgi:DNA-binding IclR family transcriptional regulator
VNRSDSFRDLVNVRLRAARLSKSKGQRPKRGIQSITVGAAVLRTLTEMSGPMPLRYIAKAAGMPASKAYRYLVSFAALGMVHQDETTGHYDLGPFSQRLGLTALGRIDAVEIVTSALARVAAEVGHDAHTTIWSQHGPIVLRWRQGASDFAVRVNEGTTLPLLTTATGRVWLAYQSENLTRDLVERELAILQVSTGQTAELLSTRYRERVEEVRRLGISHSEGERRSGIDALSVPVFGPAGIAFAITVFGTHGGSDFSYDGPTVRTLALAADRISSQLGARRGDRG